MTANAVAERADRLPAIARPLPPDIVLDAPRPRTTLVTLFGVVVILAFFGGFAAWSVLVPLAEAAIAPGTIRSEFSRRAIQHLEGGIVSEILVHDGDRVTEGQVLMRLAATQTTANLEATQASRWSLMAQDARARSELAGASQIAFPAELSAVTDARAMEAVVGQRALFEARRASLLSQIQVLEARIAQQDSVRAAAAGQLLSAETQLRSFRAEEREIAPLAAQGLIQRPRLLQVQRSATEQEGRMSSSRADMERAENAILEARNQIRQIEDQRMQETATELREVRSRLNEAEGRLGTAQDVATRRDITAPEDGTVIGMKIFNLGAVVRAGEPMMELVPARDRLVAEVQLQPNDIDVVYPGLRAEVRLPAFKQRLVPFLHGHVISVSPDAIFDDRTRASHYRVLISIDPEQLAALPNVTLVPGMPVEAQVQIGTRSFLRYMIQPVLDSFHRAFREQ
ncbi:HlyD family secretion protein [Humitalea rosea]|uniref:Membrane fusion protein (MFP) family protein n=1 Tax=Humitalea rosea TaxID=990373 RepID=A0A2W7JBQ7_9PROT|nr:HlyD family type I secretion periplasmic adaptor subunit [Humitalea rosea]PZW49131.1 HlyD family secretion protein [Humitalea rosea]